MDLSPRSLVRWIPPLTAAIGIEVALSILLGFTAPDHGILSMIRTLTHLPHVAVLAVFATAAWKMTSPDASRIACQRLLWGGFAAIAATSLARFMDLHVIVTDASRPWLVLQGAGGILIGIAGPGLWGAALARQEDLQDERIPRIARMFAVASFVGFATYFVSELIYIVSTGPRILKEASFDSGLFTLLLFGGRGCLLWVTVRAWKPAADEAAARERARVDQVLMVGWLMASFTAWTVSSVFSTFEFTVWGDRLMLAWHAIVQATLTLLVTILVALALERPALSYTPRPKGPFVPEAPPPADNSPIDVP